MDLAAIIIRSDTRIRVEFTSQPAASAFTGTGTITIISQDAFGISPTIKQRIIVISDPNSIELVLSSPIAQGSLYLLTVDSIPPVSGSPASSSELFRSSESFSQINTEVNNLDIDAALFSVDLVWTGADYLLSPDGDFATIGGKANVQSALTRRLVSDSLPWDNEYGTKSRSFVDAPSPSAPLLRGEILRQMRSDDRVLSATVDLDIPDSPGDEVSYSVNVILIGDSDNSNVSISVPTVL